MLPLNELDTLVQSADIGVALYSTEYGPNIVFTGMASGKLMQYLKCGLPIVASDLPGFRELFAERLCGICVQDETEVVSAVNHILDDYPRFRAQAQRTYIELFDYEPHFARVLSRIDEIVG